MVRRLRSIRDDIMATAPEGITARATGMPALSTDELDVLESGMRSSSLATASVDMET